VPRDAATVAKRKGPREIVRTFSRRQSALRSRGARAPQQPWHDGYCTAWRQMARHLQTLIETAFQQALAMQGQWQEAIRQRVLPGLEATGEQHAEDPREGEVVPELQCGDHLIDRIGVLEQGESGIKTRRMQAAVLAGRGGAGPRRRAAPAGVRQNRAGRFAGRAQIQAPASGIKGLAAGLA
jgi:hypothetical protein